MAKGVNARKYVFEITMPEARSTGRRNPKIAEAVKFVVDSEGAWCRIMESADHIDVTRMCSSLKNTYPHCEWCTRKVNGITSVYGRLKEALDKEKGDTNG